MTLPKSLRSQLALAGFVVIYLMVLLLFGVTYLTEDETVTTVDGVDVIQRSSDQGIGWVEISVVALAPLAAFLAWWWAGRAVRPIEQIRSVAERIEATDLSDRIGLREGPTEVVSLASSFDAMLDRLHRAAISQRHVIDEISHELRTPIAVLIANADVRLAEREPTLESYRDGLEQSRRTADRMRTTLEGLLADARASARTLDRHPADLMDVVRTIVAEMKVVGATRDVRVGLDGPTTVRGSWDTATVARALTNLVDNALRHSPAGSVVEVRVVEQDDRVEIAVSDHGPGIPASQLAHIFERSWRAEPEPGGGTGLGLAIARQIAEAHGGALTVRSPDPAGYSTTFTFALGR
jgi:signal transduction histidine kinase